MEEIWKDIPNFIGRYQASTWGRIRSMSWERTGKIRVLKVLLCGDGYQCVHLFKNGKPKTCLVHRLVWETFNGSIPEGYEVNHINEDKTDNRLENLNLMTPKENMNYGTRTQRVADKLSDPVLQLTLDYELVKEWSSASEAGRNGFSRVCVSYCCLGKIKTHKGYIWIKKNECRLTF